MFIIKVPVRSLSSMLRESTGMNGAAIDHRSLWFLNTYVTILISSRGGSDGISVLEHRASQGDSPPLHIHHDEDGNLPRA
jgi:hypothetical protein